MQNGYFEPTGESTEAFVVEWLWVKASLNTLEYNLHYSGSSFKMGELASEACSAMTLVWICAGYPRPPNLDSIEL